MMIILMEHPHEIPMISPLPMNMIPSRPHQTNGGSYQAPDFPGAKWEIAGITWTKSRPSPSGWLISLVTKPSMLA
jgi:hypothetical protein